MGGSTVAVQLQSLWFTSCFAHQSPKSTSWSAHLITRSRTGFDKKTGSGVLKPTIMAGFVSLKSFARRAKTVSREAALAEGRSEV